MVKREFSEYEEISDEGSHGPPPRSRIKLESEGDAPFQSASYSSVPPGSFKGKSEPDLDRKDISSIPTHVVAPLIDATSFTKVCMKCGEQGHVIEQCMRNSCKKCGKDATHLTAFCPVLEAIRKKTKGPCGKCGLLGHGRKKCKVEVCTACGAQGHTRKTCLVNPPFCGYCKRLDHAGKGCPFVQAIKSNPHRHYVDRAT